MANKITTYDVWVGNLPLNADDVYKIILSNNE